MAGMNAGRDMTTVFEGTAGRNSRLRKNGKRREPIECKFTPLDLKRATVDGAFEGYASIFDREDLGHDVISKGAFAESLTRRGVKGIKMLFQHDANQPIGVWDRIAEDARGLYVVGRLMPEVGRAREVLSLMRAGALDGLSIGFKPVKGRRDPRTGVRLLERVDLWEISVVTFPMLPDAKVTRVKSSPFVSGLPTKREFERWLTRDAGLTRREARAVLRDGLKGLQSLRDADGGQVANARLAQRISDAARVLKANH